MFFAPYVLGVAVIGLLWRFLLDANLGLVNRLLGSVGLPSDTPWVTDVPWAWISLVGRDGLVDLGFNAVIYLAGLQDIPAELYEAAAGRRRERAGSGSATSPCPGCARCCSSW